MNLLVVVYTYVTIASCKLEQKLVCLTLFYYLLLEIHNLLYCLTKTRLVYRLQIRTKGIGIIKSSWWVYNMFFANKGQYELSLYSKIFSEPMIEWMHQETTDQFWSVYILSNDLGSDMLIVLLDNRVINFVLETFYVIR